MYHAVKITELDQHMHNFLWRDVNQKIEPDVYVMTSVSFSDRPAGNIEIVTLQNTAEMAKESFHRQLM